MYADGQRVGGRRLDSVAQARATGIENSGSYVTPVTRKAFVFDKELEAFAMNINYTAVQPDRLKDGRTRSRADDWGAAGKGNILSVTQIPMKKSTAEPTPAELLALSQSLELSEKSRPVPPPMYGTSQRNIGFHVDTASRIRMQAIESGQWHGLGTAFSDVRHPPPRSCTHPPFIFCPICPVIAFLLHTVTSGLPGGHAARHGSRWREGPYAAPARPADLSLSPSQIEVSWWGTLQISRRIPFSGSVCVDRSARVCGAGGNHPIPVLY